MEPNQERAEQVILEILRQAGDRGLGRTKLYKVFWLAHLYYAKDNPGYLSDWPVVRMPQGPGIHRGDQLIGDLVSHGAARQDLEQVGPFAELCCRFAGGPSVSELPAPAVRAIRMAVEYAKGKTAADLSEMSHDFSRSWRTTANGQELDIYGDLIQDEGEFQERTSSMARVAAALEEDCK